MNLKVGRVCPQRAGLRMQNGSGALGTDAPYHYWVQGHNARVCSGNSLPDRGEGRLLAGVGSSGARSAKRYIQDAPGEPQRALFLLLQAREQINLHSLMSQAIEA